MLIIIIIIIMNKFTSGDCYPIPDFADVVQRMGQARYISVQNRSLYAS